MLLSNLLLNNQNTFSKISKFQTNSVAFKGLKNRELSWKNMMETTLTPAPFDAPNVREQIYRWNGPVKELSGKWSIWVLMGWLLPRMFLKWTYFPPSQLELHPKAAAWNSQLMSLSLDTPSPHRYPLVFQRPFLLQTLSYTEWSRLYWCFKLLSKEIWPRFPYITLRIWFKKHNTSSNLYEIPASLPGCPCYLATIS